MVNFNQNLPSLHRQSVRENCILFLLIEEKAKILNTLHSDVFNDRELKYDNFAILRNEIWREPYNYVAIDIYNNKSSNGILIVSWGEVIELMSD